VEGPVPWTRSWPRRVVFFWFAWSLKQKETEKKKTGKSNRGCGVGGGRDEEDDTHNSDREI
jgi:hypothetical protein